MPTNLDLDESLVAEAMRLSGLRTKKSVVEEGLRALIRLHRQTDVRRLRGLLHWQDPEPRSPAEEETEKGEPAKKRGRRAGAGPR
jgi:Arc/MetJ family transcription regulator